jgi:hypothetical protein
MTKNPILNALSATLYISLVATGIFYAGTFEPVLDRFTILAPIAFLSLFVFSAAAMGYIFLYQPFQMFLEGQKKEAANLFLQTLAAFAVTTLVTVAAGIFLSTYLS